MILPPATLGVLGGGQLGRYFVIAAQQMGYRVVVFDPDKHSVAGRIADTHLVADYHDEAALTRFASLCAAVTTEFENYTFLYARIYLGFNPCAAWGRCTCYQSGSQCGEKLP